LDGIADFDASFAERVAGLEEDASTGMPVSAVVDAIVCWAAAGGGAKHKTTATLVDSAIRP